MTQELQRLLGQIEAIKAEGRAITAGLSDAQFNWHPAPVVGRLPTVCSISTSQCRRHSPRSIERSPWGGPKGS